jgi:hypothetical protein
VPEDTEDPTVDYKCKRPDGANSLATCRSTQDSASSSQKEDHAVPDRAQPMRPVKVPAS